MSNIRRSMMAASRGGSKPYDALIEYLQGDGNAFVDLGVRGTRETLISVTFMPTITSNSDGVCGWRGDNTNSLSITSSNSVSQRFGSQSKTTTFALNVQHELTINKSGVIIDGVTTAWNQSAAFTTPSTLRLFMVNTSLSKFKGKIMSFIMSDNGVILFDMVPARVGQVGYMYDKISGQLFGNAGSGNFVLGNDIN